jgi:hypothetical protein
MFYKGHDVSPIPILEFTSALTGYSQLKEFGLKYGLSTLQLASALGFRFKALAKLNSGNFSKINYKLKLLLIVQALPSTEAQADSLMNMGAPKAVAHKSPVEAIIMAFSKVELYSIIRNIEKALALLRNDVSIYWNFGYLLPRFTEAPKTTPKGESIWTNHWAGTVGKSYLTDPNNPLSVDETKFPEKPLRKALASLVELFVIPAKGAMMEQGNLVLSQILNKNTEPTTIAGTILHFVEMARESALIRPTIVSLERTATLPFRQDPISVRLWKRWAPILQGSHGLDSLKERFGEPSFTMLVSKPKRKRNPLESKRPTR